MINTNYKEKGYIVKKTILLILTVSFFTGCTATHNPFAHIGASKTINIGGIDVGVGLHDIIQLGN